MIEAQHLSVHIQNKEVLTDINLNINRNDFWLVFGPNGAGKTTLLKSLAGHFRDFSGSIWIEGQEIHSFSRKQLSKKIAFLPQDDPFTLPFRVYDVLLLGRYPHLSFFSRYSDEDKGRVLDTAKEFGIVELLDRDIQTLSGGEKKKVLIASAFLQDVSIFLFDEPLNFLDPPSIKSLLNLLHTFLRHGKTIVVVSHFVEYFFLLANKMIALKNGKSVYCGDKVFRKDIFQSVYGISYDTIQTRNKQLIYFDG